jgi:uncharacterized protein (TIGR02452 family)
MNMAHESEYREARRLLDDVARRVEVTVVPGNHEICLPAAGLNVLFVRHGSNICGVHMGHELAAIAVDTLSIVSRGHYAAPSGARVSIADAVAAAVTGGRTFFPHDLAAIESSLDSEALRHTPPPAIEVTQERTGAAGRRLVEGRGFARVVALNFANGTHVGGGFLGGSRAQEEALCRCSSLYRCLESRPEFYTLNTREDWELSTDAMIYSPDVPFFRDEELRLLEQPFALSILTAAAPISHYVERRGDSMALLHETFHRRAGRVLAGGAALGHRVLVLGAWGCGAFGNDPVVVADAFATWLAQPRFAGAFDRVVFAVFDPAPGQPNFEAFRTRFSAT